MAKKIVIVTFKDVEFTDGSTAYFILLSNGYSVILPKQKLEDVEVTVIDEPETTPENNP